MCAYCIVFILHVWVVLFLHVCSPLFRPKRTPRLEVLVATDYYETVSAEAFPHLRVVRIVVVCGTRLDISMADTAPPLCDSVFILLSSCVVSVCIRLM